MVQGMAIPHSVRVLIYIWVAVLLMGCPFDVVHVKQIPTPIRETQHAKESWILKEDIKAHLGTGYSTNLKSGTRWDYVGSTAYGDVYRTSDQIVTVEGSNIFETYIVLSEGDLVGFYLPVEQSYAPIRSPKKVHMEPLPQK